MITFLFSWLTLCIIVLMVYVLFARIGGVFIIRPRN